MISAKILSYLFASHYGTKPLLFYNLFFAGKNNIQTSIHSTWVLFVGTFLPQVFGNIKVKVGCGQARAKEYAVILNFGNLS